MRAFQLLGAALALIITSQAYAADLGAPPFAYRQSEEVLAKGPAFNTGCYGEASTGMQVQEVEISEGDDSITLSDSDWLLGIGGGCDYVSGNFLVGALGRIDWSGAEIDGDFGYDVKYGLGLRAGFVLVPHVLVYGVGGANWTEFDEIGTEQGWFLGAGTEILLDKHISLFGEYNYEWYSDVPVMLFEDEKATLDPSMHSVRVGVKYRF